MEPISGPSSAGVPSEIVPILALSGHSPGPSLLKFACGSLQAVCPSAASGLIVSPAGRLTITDFACEGDGVKPSVWGTLKLRFSPEAASVWLVVRLAPSTGLKVSCSHPVTGGYSESAWLSRSGSW